MGVLRFAVVWNNVDEDFDRADDNGGNDDENADDDVVMAIVTFDNGEDWYGTGGVRSAKLFVNNDSDRTKKLTIKIL